MELNVPNASKLNHELNKYEGVSVKKALKLIEKSEFKEDLIKLLDISDYENDFIEIPGANLLVDIVLKREENFKKFDVDSKIKNIRFIDIDFDNNLGVLIENIDDDKVLKRLKKSQLQVKTVTQSIKSDLLDNFYSINKFASFCKDKGYDDVLTSAIREIENKQIDEKRKLRLVEDGSNLYLRGFLTAKNYNDYNIPVSLFVTLLTLHKRFVLNEESYVLESYNVGLSNIKAVFLQSTKKSIDNNVFQSFGIELNNNEIGKGSFSLKGVYSFTTSNYTIVAIPEKINTLSLFNIFHTTGLDKFKDNYLGINVNIRNAIEIFQNNGSRIKKIKNFDEVLKFLEDSFLSSKSINDKAIQIFKNKRTNRSTVKTLFEFLEQLGYIDNLLIQEDIQSLEYWRNKVYNTIFEKGK
jgi:hypothetical protein